MPDADRETIYLSAAGKPEWRCGGCPKTYLISGGTFIITQHLKGHGKESTSTREQQWKNQQITIDEAHAEAERNPNPKRRKLFHRVEGDSIDPNVLEILWVHVLVACSLALRLICLPSFRAFLQYLNPDVLAWLPTSHNTIREWVLRQYNNRKAFIQQKLQSAKSKIHISCDLWTSPNSLAILGIIAHYIDEDGKLQHSTLALKSIVGDHTGDHLAKELITVLDEWGFVSKLGYFIMDNAPNNDVMMRSLEHGISVPFKSSVHFAN
jgi:hypothetical protein